MSYRAIRHCPSLRTYTYSCRQKLLPVAMCSAHALEALAVCMRMPWKSIGTLSVACSHACVTLIDAFRTVRLSMLLHMQCCERDRATACVSVGGTWQDNAVSLVSLVSHRCECVH